MRRDYVFENSIRINEMTNKEAVRYCLATGCEKASSIDGHVEYELLLIEGTHLLVPHYAKEAVYDY